MYTPQTDPRFPLLSTFTDEERRECLPTIDLIVHLANTTRKDGVLALEAMAQDLPDESFFLKTGLMLICDGTDPELVRQIMSNYIISSCVPDPDQNAGLLRRMMEFDGVLSIQSGENPRIIEEKMLSMLGEDFHKEAIKYFGEMKGVRYEEYKHIENMSALLDAENVPCGGGQTWMNETLTMLSNHDMQLLLCKMDLKVLAIAMSGLPRTVQECVFRNVSHGLMGQIIEDMKYMGPMLESYIENAQQQIIDLIKSAQNTGEIIIARGTESQ